MKPRAFPRLKLPLLVASLAALHVPAHAQTPPPAARPVQDPAQLIIEQQREQARQRQLEQPPASITIAPTSETTLEIPPGTPVDSIVETGPTFPVQRIVLQTADGKPFEPPGGVSRAKLDAVVAPFAGHDLGSHRINVLLKRLTDVFVEVGFVTTRALLGPQNLASGTLQVTIQTGRVANFLVNGKPIHRLKAGEASAGGGWLTDAGYENAFPASPGDPLRLSDIDQGVAQINRLRRNQATVQILPGQSPGESLVDITNKPGDRLYYTLGVDNYSRNELAWVNAPAWKDGRIEPYLFLDAGKTNLIAGSGFPTLAGVGAGLRAQWQWHKQLLSGELLVGRALTQPAALGSKATLVLGTLNWNM